MFWFHYSVSFKLINVDILGYSYGFSLEIMWTQLEMFCVWGINPWHVILNHLKNKLMVQHIQHPLRINVSSPWFKDNRSPWRCHEFKKQEIFQVQVVLMDLQNGGSKQYQLVLTINATIVTIIRKGFLELGFEFYYKAITNCHTIIMRYMDKLYGTTKELHRYWRAICFV